MSKLLEVDFNLLRQNFCYNCPRLFDFKIIASLFVDSAYSNVLFSNLHTILSSTKDRVYLECKSDYSNATFAALKGAKNTFTAAGPDGVGSLACVLRNCASIIILPLYYIFDLIIKCYRKL